MKTLSFKKNLKTIKDALAEITDQDSATFKLFAKSWAMQGVASPYTLVFKDKRLENSYSKFLSFFLSLSHS